MIMSEASVVRKAIAQAQSTASGHTQVTSRQPYITEPTASKRVCFYKSGDAQFSGLPVVINSRTFKTFEALLDSLSKRVPLPFGVRTITTPRGHTTVRSLDQLHHGQSYICSDRRTVKPIDLERARRKLPPWYHARPVSSRYLAWYTHKPAQHGIVRRNEHAVLLHTPKWLVLFRNGEPEVKHRLMLQRRTTYSFDTLLNHISEVMHFPVLKLYTPDGRRVDGLPTLILCSGVLVAAGRESFKKKNYDVQKSPPPKWLTAQRFGRRRLITRKKKSSSTRSYPFSPSSEHYIVNQIQNSMPGSMCDFPCNPNGSVEVELGQPLESVAETEMIPSLDGDREDDALLPSDDDIEKSFRVNQDGSMTVEMKVRLTIKEEETIHWSTTVSRSSVNNQFKSDIVSCPALDGNIPPENNTGAMEASSNESPNSSHSCLEEGCKVNEHPEINGGAASMEIERQLSPFAHFHQQGSINSIYQTTSDGEHNSYSSMENTGNGKIKHEECMVQHFNHPVPKPRCTVPPEMNTTTRLQTSNYRSSEILQYQDNQRKVQETVLHIYENQTCQVNLSGNIQLGLQGSSSHGSSIGCTESPDSLFPAALSTIKCQSPGKQDDSTMSSTYKASSTSTKRASVLVNSSNASEYRGVPIHGTTTKRKPVRVIVKKNHLFKSANTEKTQKDYKADILKEIKKIRADILSQKGAMKPRKHFRTKAVQKLLKKRNNSGNGSTQLKPQTDLETDDPSLLLGENKQNNISVQADSYTVIKNNLPNASLSKGTLTRKTSEYVELWLQKSEPQPVCPVESSLETIPKYNTMVKASLFNHKSVETVQPSTKETFDEKKSYLHSPRTKKASLIDKEHISDHVTAKQSTTNSYDSENRKPSENTEPPTELTDFQAQKCYTVKMSVRPDMKPVLDQLCNSIRSLRDVIQHKLSLRLKTSECMPDFFAHLASTFSSSSGLLFAFLSIMTLKDGLSHLNACCQSQTNISSSEAMLMLQSLKELALIEDTEHLRISLSDLHKSASVQLLQSWNGFQSLSEKSLRRSATSDTTGNESHHMPSSNEEEQAIQVLMEHLGVPERVREELAALNHIHEFMISNKTEDTVKMTSSQSEVKITELHPKEKIANFSNVMLEDYVNIYVNSVIDRAINAHIQNSDHSQVFLTGTLVIPEMDNLVITDRYQKDVRKENFYNIMRTFQDNAKADSDICEDMSSSESMHKGLVSNGIDEQGMEEEPVRKHHKKEDERRVERLRETNEERDTSKSLNTVLNKEEVMGKVVSQKENFSQVDENGRHDESLPQERFFHEERNLTVKSTGPDEEVQQICPKEKSSGLWQNEFQTTQTEDLLQNETQKTDKEISLAKVQTVAYFDDTESNIEEDEIQHSMTHKDSSMGSRAYSEEEDVILEAPECYTIYQESFEEIPEEVIRYEENEFNYNDESLEEQDESAEKIPLNITKTTDGLMDSVSSSLAFSYDSKNNALAKDLEVHMQANRVKSIREMFLAKSNADIHQGQMRLSSPNLSDYPVEPSDTQEHQSSASMEILREEKGTCRLSIAKGYVRRTIEQLYGKGPKGSNSDEKRSISADKVTKREDIRNANAPRLSSIHKDHKNATPDLSYFNPTCSVDGFKEQTHCVSLNARMGPKDAVLIDKGRWLLRDNQVSCPETEDTPKHSLAKSEQDSGKEDIPYSFFGHSPMKPKKNPEQEEIAGCPGKTFTYFHLPNANDSEVQPDEQKADTPKTKTENKVSPLTESPKHRITTVFTPPDIKKAANKVHPLLETTPPVVTQPTKKQGTQVARHSVEPDALEILYMFCGQHCPIL